MRRPFIYIAVGLISGIALTGYAALPWYLLLAAACVALGVFLRSLRNTYAGASLFAASLSIGYLLALADTVPPPHALSRAFGTGRFDCRVLGTVVDDPVISPDAYGTVRTEFLLRLQTARFADRALPVSGTISVSVEGRAERLEYGDRVLADGSITIRPALSGISYLRLLRIDGYLRINDLSSLRTIEKSGSVIGKYALRVRRATRACIDRSFGASRAGAIVRALTIGDRGILPREVSDSFVKTGTVHILSISGFHVAILGSALIWLQSVFGIPRKARLIISLAGVSFYALVAGANPPVVRASVMYALFVAGALIERERDGLHALAIAAAFMLVADPRNAFDIGFQLSFASVAAILILSPKIAKSLEARGCPRRGIGGSVCIAFAVSSAAFLGTAPLVARSFNIISPVSLIANMLVVPLTSLIMALAALFFVAGAISAVAAGWIAGTINASVSLLIGVNGAFAELPAAFFRTSAPYAGAVVLYYCTLAALFAEASTVKRSARLPRSRVVLALLLLAWNGIVWTQAATTRHGPFRAAFLDVGHGDATVIEFPGGETMLIDGGSGGSAAPDRGRSVVAPFLWNLGITAIDAVVLSHADEDHLGGLIYVIENFRVRYAIDNGRIDRATPLGRRYLEAVEKSGARRIVVGKGDEIIGFGGGRVFVLNPRKDLLGLGENEDSIVLKIVSKKVAILLAGDIGQAAMRRLIEEEGAALKTEILKVPHHGGQLGETRTVDSFFEAVMPLDSIISVAAFDRYGAPALTTLKSLSAVRTRLHKTSEAGNILLLANGENYEIRYGKQIKI